MIHLDVQRLSRDFGPRRVLSDLSFSLAPGDRLAVTGANGSGKSTLLKVLAGLLRPTSGHVAASEGPEGASRSPAWLRERTGYLAPDLALYDELTPRENLDFFGRLRPVAGRDTAGQLLERVGLAERADDPLGSLSTGLRQRVKLAFALQADPALLLLDEPGANLDAAGRELIREVVEGAGDAVVVIATNDPVEARLGGRSLVLE